jgi:yecA family protein
MNDLLQAPERAAIEAFLDKLETLDGQAPSYERLLGFLSGVVITPGPFMPSQWIQPLLDKIDIVFQDAADANLFMGVLMPLHNRINELRLLGENLYPFGLLDETNLESMHRPATDWATGLHDALTLQADIWAPSSAQEVAHVPAKLLEEMGGAIPFLWALADPKAIPEIMPDPVPFQKNFLSRAPGWQSFMMRTAWDEELIEMFGLFCISQLETVMDTLQRYAKSYDMEKK